MLRFLVVGLIAWNASHNFAFGCSTVALNCEHSGKAVTDPVHTIDYEAVSSLVEVAIPCILAVLRQRAVLYAVVVDTASKSNRYWSRVSFMISSERTKSSRQQSGAISKS